MSVGVWISAERGDGEAAERTTLRLEAGATIGSGSGCDLQLDDLPRIAAVLAAANIADGGLVLHGHEPKDGLRVDGVAAERCPLDTGTIIGLGSWQLHVESMDAVGQTGAQDRTPPASSRQNSKSLGISLAFLIGLISGAAAIACIWWLSPPRTVSVPVEREVVRIEYRDAPQQTPTPATSTRANYCVIWPRPDLSDEARALVARHGSWIDGQQPTLHLGLDDRRLSFTEIQDWDRFLKDFDEIPGAFPRRMPEGGTLIPSSLGTSAGFVSQPWPLVFSLQPLGPGSGIDLRRLARVEFVEDDTFDDDELDEATAAITSASAVHLVQGELYLFAFVERDDL
jgi:hypothetical protein